jgi:DNA-binding XRE family transcriptional regulator
MVQSAAPLGPVRWTVAGRGGRGEERHVRGPEEVAGSLAANLRRLRALRGWSLEAVAERAEVSKNTVIQVEQGRANPSIATLCRLADALGVGVASLIEAPASPRVTRPPCSRHAGAVDLGGGQPRPVLPRHRPAGRRRAVGLVARRRRRVRRRGAPARHRRAAARPRGTARAPGRDGGAPPRRRGQRPVRGRGPPPLRQQPARTPAGSCSPSCSRAAPAHRPRPRATRPRRAEQPDGVSATAGRGRRPRRSARGGC